MLIAISGKGSAAAGAGKGIDRFALDLFHMRVPPRKAACVRAELPLLMPGLALDKLSALLTGPDALDIFTLSVYADPAAI